MSNFKKLIRKICVACLFLMMLGLNMNATDSETIPNAPQEVISYTDEDPVVVVCYPWIVMCTIIEGADGNLYMVMGFGSTSPPIS